ncbi:hypothetical protein HLB23_23440 [Nocardia uniformis]|uniref:Uncharacterized protein n=1 Tax=Nocardia uniformis TaxID=53432 RepID=A0A849C244_9NOCA|nr:hypothetical protein [Nocardia uniformis]NNH72782.1 hypothetical protein [Nocardia uniformis]
MLTAILGGRGQLRYRPHRPLRALHRVHVLRSAVQDGRIWSARTSGLGFPEDTELAAATAAAIT